MAAFALDPVFDVAEAGARVIVVDDLDLLLRIGAYEAEKLAPQRVRISAEILVRPEHPAHGDRLSSVVDYGSIIEKINALADSPHIELQETLAEKVARICLEPSEAVAARVHVRKLDAYPNCGGVGIRVLRTK